MAYNLSLLTENESLSGIFSAANSYTDGLLVGLLVLSLFFIMLLVLKRWDFLNALLSSSFVCFVISALLVAGGFLSLYWALGFLILAALTVLYMSVSGNY
jgi:hypothetical protein